MEADPEDDAARRLASASSATSRHIAFNDIGIRLQRRLGNDERCRRIDRWRHGNDGDGNGDQANGRDGRRHDSTGRGHGNGECEQPGEIHGSSVVGVWHGLNDRFALDPAPSVRDVKAFHDVGRAKS
jgi:hypothetical protein